MPIPKLIALPLLIGAQIALGAMRKIEGPRLKELDVTLAEFNTPLPRFWGARLFEGCPIIWAEKLREVKKKSKTKAGKYAEYKYYGTWAVAICDCPNGPIDAVSKIRLDKHPVYQVTGVGPIAALIQTAIEPPEPGSIKLEKNKNLSVYLGTEDQQPNPRIEAWFEDNPNFGANMAPGFRGTAYIVFKDIPLEKFGNRIPQVDVEVISSANGSYPYETFTGGYSPGKMYFSPDATRFFIGSSTGGYQVWDTPTRTLLYTGVINPMGAVAVNNDGSFYCRDGTTSDIVRVFDGGSYTISLPNPGLECGGNLFKAGGAIWADGSIGSTDACLLAFSIGEVVNYDIGFRATYYFADEDDNAWATGELPTADGFGIAQMLPFDTTKKYFVDTGSAGIAFAMDNGAGQFFCWQNDQLYLVNMETGDIDLGPVAAPGFTATDDSVIFRGVQPGAPKVWIGFTEVSTTTLATTKTESIANWVGSSGSTNPVYDPINDAIWTKTTLGVLTVRYLNRVTSNGVPLSEIIEDIGGWCGMSIDAGDLDQLVKGFSVPPGPGKDMMAPLLDIHHSLLRPHDFGIFGIKHSTTSQDTIDVSEFVVDGGDRYTIEVAQDTDIARQLTVSFADVGKAQQTNNVIATRATDAIASERDQSIDMATYVDSPDGMQQKADRFLRWLWNSRAVVKSTINAQYLAAEPGDVYDLALDDGVTWSCELERATFSATSPQIVCEWRRVFPSLVNLGSQDGAEMGGVDPDEIFVPGPAKGFFLDIPLTADNENDANPLIHYAAGSYGVGTVAGVGMLEGDVDGEFSDFGSVASADLAVWGYANTALGDVYTPFLWDRGNSFDVQVIGTLSNSTEAAINLDPTINMFALRSTVDDETHWELGNFTTATLTGTNGVFNVYTISGLKRGRRGTEWTTGGHAIGDEFVLVSDMAVEPQGLSEVGTTLEFKAQTFGRDPDSAPEVDIEFEGESLMPYAPARVVWSTDGTDLFGEIIRRTRVGGSWNGGSTIPLSENSEAYEVDVLDGSDVVIDTIAVTGTNTFTVTGADLTGYGYSLSSLPSVNVYQLSDAVGRGFPLAA